RHGEHMRQTSGIRRAVLVAATVSCGWVVALGCPRRADTQVIEQITKRAKQRADARKKKLDSTMVQTAGQVIDSSVEKTGRAVDAVVNAAGKVVDTVFSKTEHGVSGVFSQWDGDAAGKLVAQLAAN